MKVRLRHSNCLKLLKSLEEAPNTQLYESCAHPRNSWMWEFTLAKALRALGFQSSIGAHCCFGGEREKWFEFRNNIPALHQYLNRALPGSMAEWTQEILQWARAKTTISRCLTVSSL